MGIQIPRADSPLIDTNTESPNFGRPNRTWYQSFQQLAKGDVILNSPNGTRYRITVNDAGVLSTVMV